MRYFLKQVGKMYPGKIHGLENFSFEFDSKRIGLLGEYGSGKSSLINILASVTKPTHGSVMFNGTDLNHSSDELRSMMGYLPQNFGMYGTLSAQEYLQYISALKGINRSATKTTIKSVLDMVRFTETNRTILGSLSSGMRQRVGVAQLLLTDPKVVIIDELSDDLLPEERNDILEVLKERTKNKMLIFASEQADDFNDLVDEIIILSAGKLALHTTPEEFISRVQNQVWEISITNMTLSNIRRRYLTTKSEQIKDGIRIRCISEGEPAPTALQVPATLNDAFQHFLSETLRSN